MDEDAHHADLGLRYLEAQEELWALRRALHEAELEIARLRDLIRRGSHHDDA
jgi:hypothetical protein